MSYATGGPVPSGRWVFVPEGCVFVPRVPQPRSEIVIHIENPKGADIAAAVREALKNRPGLRP